MKIKLIALMLFFGTAFTSCKKDNQNIDDKYTITSTYNNKMLVVNIKSDINADIPADNFNTKALFHSSNEVYYIYGENALGVIHNDGNKDITYNIKISDVYAGATILQRFTKANGTKVDIQYNLTPEVTMQKL
ncbi:hypothetical protein [Pedobacter gandavensis]|uniref:hypothetical protein n=1 Tax=Pedobacter gandavensis TaxID=2679963 RepID=UPI002930EC5B|nr:hypothetical protein [Pedobacter gandavensis]